MYLDMQLFPHALNLLTLVMDDLICKWNDIM